MLIPRYWARVTSEERTPAGRRVPFSCCQWSERSLGEAQARARETATRIAQRIRSGGPFPERYAYGARPLREEALREIRGSGDAPAAVLTRNAYGAVVLNAAATMFVDVDLAREHSLRGGSGPSLRERLGTWLRGRGASATAAGSASQAAALVALERFVGSRVGWGFRVYRTRAGLRYLATHATFDPASDESAAAMAALGCDPHYVKLCRSQKSFRARLTPKPWRCGMRMPPARWPFEGAAEEARARQWEAKYDAACARFATCALLKTVGSQWVHRDVEAIVRVHDELSRAESGLPLA